MYTPTYTYLSIFLSLGQYVWTPGTPISQSWYPVLFMCVYVLYVLCIRTYVGEVGFLLGLVCYGCFPCIYTYVHVHLPWCIFNAWSNVLYTPHRCAGFLWEHTMSSCPGHCNESATLSLPIHLLIFLPCGLPGDHDRASTTLSGMHG